MRSLLQFLSGKYWPLIFVMMVLLFTTMRMVRITADAPPELSISAALYTDEGLKTISAKNMLLYGSWKWTPSDRYSSWHDQSPVPTFLYEKWFSLFGFGLASIRYQNILVSVITMCFLFFFVKRRYDIITAFLALFIFGISHFTSMYQRLGFYENLLVLFSLIICMTLFDLYDRRSNLMRVLHDSSVNPVKEIGTLTVSVTIGCIATVCVIYTKQSIILIPLALLPYLYLYFLYSHHRLNRYVIKNFYLVVMGIALFYFFFAHFDSFESIFVTLLDRKIFDVQLGYILPFKRGSSNFDPLYLMIAKSLFIEFIFLQPVIFFSAIFFALFVFHNFIYKQTLHTSDMIFSSWFLFGFLFLSLLKYHPSRYYLLLTIPLVILSARFFTYPHKEELAQLIIQERRISLRRVIASGLKFYFIFNLGVSLLMLVLPLQVKKGIYDDLFFKFSSHRYTEAFPTIGFLLGWQVVIFAISLPLMSHLYRAISKKTFYRALIILMLFLQIFQYTKWVIFAETNQYDFSKALGTQLPSNAVIAGGWSTGLTIENTLRPIVIQGKLDYNTKLIRKLYRNNNIKAYKRLDGSGKPEIVNEKNIPIYLAVSSNGEFDGRIREKYVKLLTRENIVRTQRLGYYDIILYRLLKPKK